MNNNLINIHELIDIDPNNNIPISDEEYNEKMKFTSDDNEIDISQVEFRIETAERICKEYDLDNFMAKEE